MVTNNWRGCKDIEFVHHNEWADPDLIYNGYVFNYWDIENALWNDFCEQYGISDEQSENPVVESKFNEYVCDYAVSYMEDCIFGGYFAEGSKSWHDR